MIECTKIFYIYFLASGTVLTRSLTTVAMPLPYTPLCGKFSSSIEKEILGLFHKFLIFLVVLGVIIKSFSLSL
jgi:hypothetical protein